MYKEHKVFKPPENENTRIWRYMDFTEFVSLLDKSALFFARADKLEDPFEGAYSKANAKLQEEFYKKHQISVPAEKGVLSIMHDFFIKTMAINSWHINEYESAAMWKLYLKSDEGIAIQSTFNRLKNSIIGEQVVYIGKIKYRDYEKDMIPSKNVFSPFLHKRKSFEHEIELRAIAHVSPEQGGNLLDIPPAIDNGLYISVNLDTLVDNIYIAPTCPAWLLELVKSITKKYNLNKNVLQSSLNAKPIF